MISEQIISDSEDRRGVAEVAWTRVGELNQLTVHETAQVSDRPGWNPRIQRRGGCSLEGESTGEEASESTTRT
jgi:hypothetical protein